MLRNPKGKLLPKELLGKYTYHSRRGTLFIPMAVTSDILTFINININKKY